MGLQKHFKEFNKKIKMDYDELSELAEKRDIILKKLRADESLPSFDEFNQGSYAMFTGVEPLDKDYDIDVGLRFKVNKKDYDALNLKKMVYEILKDHTDYGAEIKKPCVTVKYKKNGEVAYHVDLAIYAYEDKDNVDSQLYLARGTNEDNKEWEISDAIKLKSNIMDKWTDVDQRNQYRRIIRYMKRWKNIKFKSNGNGEPPGIGITLLAYEEFNPQKYDWLESKYVFDDLEALTLFVQAVKTKFVPTRYLIENGQWLYKIEAFLKVNPFTNVFQKMTEVQMTNFKKLIDKLYDDLEDVKQESDVVEQCKKLNKIFGEDFPIPTKENESKVQRNFVPASSASGDGR